MNRQYVINLQERLTSLNESIHNLTKRRDQLLLELEENQRIVFEAETGLHYGDELFITDEFMTFEEARGNDGHWWRYYWERDSKPLRLDKNPNRYFSDGTVDVIQGSTGTGGVPVDMVQRMRKAWLDQYPVVNQSVG